MAAGLRAHGAQQQDLAALERPMHIRFGKTLLAGTSAAVVGFAWHAPAAAAFVTYTYEGSLSSIRCRADCGPLATERFAPFSATVTIDTGARRVSSFDYSLGRVLFSGSGGFLSVGSDQLEVDLGRSNYTTEPLSVDTFRLWLNGPATAFGNFVDGFATTFNLAAISPTFLWVHNASRPDEINVSFNLTSVSAQVTGLSVPEPGTAALAGLAGLAALRASRRRKTAAA